MEREAFLDRVLDKVVRRYERKGTLSGTMKLGQSLSSREMALLGNFFGLDPLRINAREEVRLYFDKLLENGSLQQWLNRIADQLGCSIAPVQIHDRSPARLLRSRLSLAFPELEPLIASLKDDCTPLERMFSGKEKDSAGEHCFQAAETVRFLLGNSEPITLSELGARFCNDSKRLRQGKLRALVMEWLRICSPDGDILEKESDLLARYHVLSDRLTVHAVFYGPVIYEKDGKVFDWILRLYQHGEPAIIGWSTLRNIDRISWYGDEPLPLICCENEAPFSRLMRENRQQGVLFTSGFPGSAVQRLYQLLGPRASACYHWGDSDPAGLRIAALMHTLFPLQLYRCTFKTLQHHKHCLLPLTAKQRYAAERLLLDQSGFPFTEELLFTLDNGWLEQESWQE